MIIDQITVAGPPLPPEQQVQEIDDGAQSIADLDYVPTPTVQISHAVGVRLQKVHGPARFSRLMAFHEDGNFFEIQRGNITNTLLNDLSPQFGPAWHFEIWRPVGDNIGATWPDSAWGRRES